MLTVCGLGGVYHLAVAGMAMGLTLGLKIDDHGLERKLFVWGQTFYNGVRKTPYTRHGTTKWPFDNVYCPLPSG